MAAVISLDQIVKNVLMRRGYSLHWYIQFMVYSKDCLRELTFDVLRVVNTKLLPVDDYNAFDLPDDYVDYTRVGVRVGQFIKPLVPNDSINPLNNYSDTFEQETYASESQTDDDELIIYGANNWTGSMWNTTHFNNYGEPVGRFFGGAGGNGDGFKIVKERGQGQLDESIDVDYIVLEYIGNGQSIDSASQIDPYAQATIEAYILWQMKLNNRTYSAGEAAVAEQEYIKQYKRLVARKSPLTLDVLKRIIHKATYAAPKS
jgi:hypothetical protein